MPPVDLYASPDLYDLVHQGYDRGEVACYARHIAASGGLALELACGTGRLTWPLAVQGLAVIGVDNAPAMLARARQAVHPTATPPQWVQADMRALPFGQAQFALVFIGINSLGHLLTGADLAACLRGVRAGLRPGGTLLVSVDNPRPATLDGAEHTLDWGAFPLPDGAALRLTEHTRYEAATQINHRRWVFHLPGGAVMERHLCTRVFPPADLLALLRANGFAITAHWGNYTGQPFHRRAAVQVVAATPARDG